MPDTHPEFASVHIFVITLAVFHFLGVGVVVVVGSFSASESNWTLFGGFDAVLIKQPTITWR